MSKKYTVMAIAYRDIDEQTENKLYRNTVSILKTAEDVIIENSVLMGRGTIDYINIYKRWFKEVSVQKIKENYTVAYLQFPYSITKSKEMFFNELDIECGDELLVVGIEHF